MPSTLTEDLTKKATEIFSSSLTDDLKIAQLKNLIELQAVTIEKKVLEAETEQQNDLDNIRAKIISDDITKGDTFTRHARPMVVYAGLFFIFLIYVALPSINFLFDLRQILPTLPKDFWVAWGSVVSVWAVGRSYEKVNGANVYSSWITGAISK